MIPFQTIYRVTYSDTDQMNFMHHSNYLKCFETARWELFRAIGIPYCEIEKTGIIMPVIDVSVKYIKPVCYDQEIVINTIIKKYSGARIIFGYEITNYEGQILNKAEVSVACVKKNTGRACFPPKNIKDTLEELANQK